MILLDEPSMGLAPQIVEEIFEIVKNLNTKEKVSFLLAEQNTMVALRFADFGYILENGRVVMEGTAHALSENEDVKEFYLGISTARPQELPRHQELPAPQAVAVVTGEHYDALETREPAARERDLMARLPGQLAHARKASAHFGAALAAFGAEDIRTRPALARLPVTRKSTLMDLQRALPPFGGLNATPASGLARIFVSPGPIYDPEGRRPDFWRTARALFAAGFRAGDVVLNCYSYHLTPAGSMFETGLHRVGCAVIPGGVGQTEMQARAIADLRALGLRRHAVVPEDDPREVRRAGRGRVLDPARAGLRRGVPAAGARVRARPRHRCLPGLRHRGPGHHRLRDAGARRAGGGRGGDRSRSSAPAPATRWPRARWARWSSRRSTRTTRWCASRRATSRRCCPGRARAGAPTRASAGGWGAPTRPPRRGASSCTPSRSRKWCAGTALGRARLVVGERGRQRHAHAARRARRPPPTRRCSRPSRPRFAT